jgi:lactoylglutathione lyase
MYRFQWVTLRVADMEKSLRFYGDLLGMEVARHIQNEHNEINMMGTENDVYVELIHTAWETVAMPGHGVSIGLSVDHLAELLTKLKAAGVPVEGPVSPNPHLTFYFVTDPDGYTIQLM